MSDRMRQRRLDELTTWSAARDLAVAVYQATRRRAFDADPELRAELRASATALVTLVAQGYEQRTCGAFEQCLTAALGAAARLESLSYVAEDIEGLSRSTAARLRRQIDATARLIDTLRGSVIRFGLLERTPVATRVN